MPQISQFFLSVGEIRLLCEIILHQIPSSDATRRHCAQNPIIARIFVNRPPTFFFAILSLLVFLTISDYGMTNLEPLYVAQGYDLAVWYARTLGLTETLTQPSGTLYGAMLHILDRLSPLSSPTTYHTANAIVGLLGIIAVYRIGKLIRSGSTGLLAALLLTLTPVYYGAIFNNPVDTPFAVAYIWSLYGMVCLVRRGNALPVQTTLPTSIVIGFATALQPHGISLLGYLAVGIVLTVRQSPIPGPERSRWAIRAGTLLFVSILTAVVLRPSYLLGHPVAETNPPVFTIFGGEYVRSSEVSRWYAPALLSLVLPESIWIGLICAIVSALLGNRFIRSNSPSLGLIAAAACIPILIVVLLGADLSDGIRQLLFILPPLAICAAFGITSAFRQLADPRARQWLCAVVGLTLALTAWETIRIHPYQSSYYNHLSGTVDSAWLAYDTDAGQSSYLEGLEWIGEHGPQVDGRPTRVGGLFHDAVLNQLDSDAHEVVWAWEDPDLYLGTVRFGENRALPGEILHTVTAGNAELLHIIRPDNSYVDNPDAGMDPFILKNRLKILAKGAAYSERNGDKERATSLYRDYGRLSSALGYHREATRAESKTIYLKLEDDPEAIHAKATALIEEGRPHIAEMLLEKLIVKHRKKVYFRDWLIALGNQGHYEKGLRQSERFLHVFPEDIEGHAIRALMLIKTGNPGAAAYVQQMKNWWPGHPTVLRVERLLNAG